MQKGRQVPTLQLFTFPDTGITVQLHKVSPLLRDDIDAMLRRQFPPPDPPLNTVPSGFGDGAPRQEPNEADPNYQMALARWRIEHINRTGDKLMELAIRSYIVCDVDHEAVARLRASMQALGVELDPDDAYVYISRICIGTPDDQRDLSTALFTRAAALREAAQAHKDTFPGDVSGQADRQDPNAPIGTPV